MNEEEQALELEHATNKVNDEKLARYDEIRAEAEILYKAFRPVVCPALNGKEVHFSSEGFNHLIYRIPKQERNKRVQIMRFELLEKARELLGKTAFMQEFEEYYDRKKTWVRKQPRWENVIIRDIGFVGIVKGYRIKVVVRKIGEGRFQFFSVIPAWSTRYYRDIKLVRNSKGNVADD
ncbi:MAG TPA: hypothetical protein VG934_03350 [Candidatus Paceibacterota bacterium]|nr:hypothetical protein [Candidatus Paceibacterota bacterium]